MAHAQGQVFRMGKSWLQPSRTPSPFAARPRPASWVGSGVQRRVPSLPWSRCSVTPMEGFNSNDVLFAEDRVYA